MPEVTELWYNQILDNMTHPILCFIYCPSCKFRVRKFAACDITLNNKRRCIPSAWNFLNIYRNASTKCVNLEYMQTNTPGFSNLRPKSNLNVYPGDIDIISTCTCMWLSYLNFFLLFVVFPGISNPGPTSHPKVDRNKNISVFYQNVEGLIPFSNLADHHPSLDNNKIYEFQAYICDKSPDIIILNETWLKPTVLSSEILPCQYNVFRLDRSPNSHPIDPLNPNKFKKNGGSVLIAVHNDLSIQSKTISVKCAAELLAVELTLGDGSKIILTTCYRVGTLGMLNCNEVLQTSKQTFEEKNASQICSHRWL